MHKTYAVPIFSATSLIGKQLNVIPSLQHMSSVFEQFNYIEAQHVYHLYCMHDLLIGHDRYEEEDRLSFKVGCRLLESAAMEIFAAHRWSFRNIIVF
jgi:hypothetical protein